MQIENKIKEQKEKLINELNDFNFDLLKDYEYFFKLSKDNLLSIFDFGVDSSDFWKTSFERKSLNGYEAMSHIILYYLLDDGEMFVHYFDAKNNPIKSNEYNVDTCSFKINYDNNGQYCSEELFEKLLKNKSNDSKDAESLDQNTIKINLLKEFDLASLEVIKNYNLLNQKFPKQLEEFFKLTSSDYYRIFSEVFASNNEIIDYTNKNLQSLFKLLNNEITLYVNCEKMIFEDDTMESLKMIDCNINDEELYSIVLSKTKNEFGFKVDESNFLNMIEQYNILRIKDFNGYEPEEFKECNSDNKTFDNELLKIYANEDVKKFFNYQEPEDLSICQL